MFCKILSRYKMCIKLLLPQTTHTLFHIHIKILLNNYCEPSFANILNPCLHFFMIFNFLDILPTLSDRIQINTK